MTSTAVVNAKHELGGGGGIPDSCIDNVRNIHAAPVSCSYVVDREVFFTEITGKRIITGQYTDNVICAGHRWLVEAMVRQFVEH